MTETQIMSNPKSKPFIALLCGIIITLVLSRFITPYMTLASSAYFIMLTGVLLRPVNIKAHASAMTLAVAMDLALVIILQIKRDAVGTAIAFQMSPFHKIHILASLTATLLYVPVITMGALRMKGKTTSKIHARVGMIAFIARSIGFIMMFSVLNKN